MHHITPFWDEKFINFLRRGTAPPQAPAPRRLRRLDSRVFGARPATPNVPVALTPMAGFMLRAPVSKLLWIYCMSHSHYCNISVLLFGIDGTEQCSKITLFRRTPASSACLIRMRWLPSALHQRNLPVLNWRCQLTRRMAVKRWWLLCVVALSDSRRFFETAKPRN